MKRFLPFLILAGLALPAPQAQAAAWDLSMTQRDASGVNRQRIVTVTANSVLGFDAGQLPVAIATTGTGKVVKETAPTLLDTVTVAKSDAGAYVAVNATNSNASGSTSLRAGYNANLSAELRQNPDGSVSVINRYDDPASEVNIVLRGSGTPVTGLRVLQDGTIVPLATALATNATGGFWHVRSGAGAPSGTPTAYTGTTPLYVDATNNALYIYTNSAWRVVTGGGGGGGGAWGSITGTLSAQADLAAALDGKVSTTAIDTVAERTALGIKSTTGGSPEELQAHGNTGSTQTFDLATANVHTATLDANCTFTLSGFTSGKYCSGLLGLLQDGTGSRTVTWPGAVVTAPTLNPTANSITWVSFWSHDGGTTIYAQSDYSTTTTSGTALLKGNGSGGIANATSGTDYAPATSGTAILKGNGSGGFSAATSGTDYAPATSGTGLLKGNGSGGTATATAGTDYLTKATRTVQFPLTIDGLADGMSYTIGRVPAAFTITGIYAVHEGSGLSSPSILLKVFKGTDRTSGTEVVTAGNTVTSSTTGSSITSFDSASVSANSWLWVTTASKSGTTANFSVVVTGTYD